MGRAGRGGDQSVCVFLRKQGERTPLYISRGFSGQWVNRFVLSCLAMALIGGPLPKIVPHPPEQFILQIIVNLKKSDFSSLSPPAELTIVQLHHRSAA